MYYLMLSGQDINRELDSSKTISDPMDGSSVTAHPDKNNVEGNSLRTDKNAILGVPQTLSLDNYISREFLVYADTVPTFPAITNLDLVNLFFGLPDVLIKLKYFYLVRGTFRIRALMTANPYVTGQVGLCGHFDREFTGNDGSLNHRLQNHKFHVLDAARVNQVSFDVPLLLQNPYLTIATLDPAAASDIRLWFGAITPFISTQDGTTIAPNLRIYLSFVDAQVSVSIPRGTTATYTSEVTETLDGPISYPASILAKFSSALSKAPIIGKFAYATSIAAGAISKIAILFGFSRPRNYGSFGYPHFEDYTSYASEVRSKALSLDPQQEIPVDNSYLNDPSDCMKFDSNVRQYGYLYYIAWDQLGEAGDVLTKIPVCPALSEPISGTLGLEFAPNNLAYISQLYTLWRGALVYKFVFMANHFVRGKVRIWINSISADIADGAWQTTSVPQNAYSVVVDLSMQTEVEVEVPYMHYRTWATVPLLVPSSQWEDSTFNYTCISGYIYMTIEEPLVAPSDSFYTSILVYVKGGKSFELSIPTNDKIQLIAAPCPPVTTNTAFPAVVNLAPFAQAEITDFQTRFSNWAIYTSVTELISVTLAPNMDKSDATIVTMGETFDSLRPLLKRYYPMVNFPSSSVLAAYSLKLFPVFPGRFGNHKVLLLVYESYEMNTPVRYLSEMFYGWKGTMRHMFLTDVRLSASGRNYITITKNIGQPYACYTVAAANTTLSTRDFYALSKVESGRGEAAYNQPMGENIMVDIPNQYLSLFQQRTAAYHDGLANTMPVISVNQQLGNQTTDMQLQDYISIGEDFNFVGFNAPPIVMLGNF